MKQNSYIIPAVQFYILKVKEDLNRYSPEEAMKKINKEIERQDFSLVSFDEVDGLTIEELKDSIHAGKYIAFTAVVLTNEYYIKRNLASRVPNYYLIDTAVFNTEFYSDMEIGKRIEQYIETDYASFSTQKKRIYNSFLEKYQYNGYEEVKEKIKVINALAKKNI